MSDDSLYKDNYSYRYPVVQPSLSPGVRNFKTVVLYSLISAGTAAGLFYLGRNWVKKLEQEKVQDDATKEDNPAFYATQFKMAFDNDNWLGWGTNSTLVFNTILLIPTKKAYTDVQAAYQKLYNRSLNADLESELDSSEYNRFILILSSKPES